MHYTSQNSQVQLMNLASFFIIIISFLCCTNSIESSKILILTDSCSFTTKYILRAPWFSVINYNNENYICNFDQFKKNVYAFPVSKVNSRVIDKTIQTPQWTERVYFHNSDSLFFIDQHTGQIKIVNLDGITIDTFIIPLVLNDIKRMICFHSPNYLNINNNNIILTALPYVKLEEFYTHPMELIYSLLNKKIEGLFLKFPMSYQHLKDWGGLGMNYTKCVNQNGDILYNFPFENKIIKIDNNILSSIDVPKSRFLKKFPPAYVNDDSLMFSKYVIEFANTTNYYYSILYDKFQDCYLRVVAHSQNAHQIDSTGTIIYNQFYDRNWSIMFLDHNFKLLGEQQFSGKKYNFETVMVSNQGIYIGETLKENLDSIQVYKFHLFKYEF